MPASVSLSRAFRLSLLAVIAGTPAAARAATDESAATPSSPVVVSGPLACPDQAALSLALQGMLPARGAGEDPDVLTLSPRPGGLSVRLLAPGGALIGEKDLVTGEGCQARAQTVAVLVAAWETRWRAGSPGALPHSGVVPPVAGAEAPAAAPPLAPPVAAPGNVLAETVSTRHEAAPLQLETRAGLLMSIAGGTVAPALSCDVSIARRGGPFAIAVGALAVGDHDVPVGPASARWRRLGATIEARSRMVRPSWTVEMHAAVALTALSISGEALPVTAGDTLFDPGLIVGVRGQLRALAFSPWIEASAALWPETHSVYLRGATDQRDLPPFEVFLGAGVAFGAGP